LTESEDPDRDEKIRGLQRRFPEYAWAQSLCFQLSAIPQEVGKNELLEAIVSTTSANVRVVPVHRRPRQQFWSAFVSFESEEDFRCFESQSKRIAGISVKSSEPVPLVEEHIMIAKEKLEAAKAQYKVYETYENRKILRDAQRSLAMASLGLRILFKGNNYCGGQIMCSHALPTLRDTSPSSFLVPRLKLLISDAQGTLAVQKNIKEVQESTLNKLENIDPNMSESTGDSSTFEVLQNLRNGKAEDKCDVCFEPLANDIIALTRCGHLFCRNCYNTVHNVDFKHCAICRKPVRLDETQLVDPKHCEDPKALEAQHRQAVTRLREVAEELEKSNGTLSADMWKTLYNSFPRPTDSNECENARFPALPGDLVSHMQNATGLPIGISPSPSGLICSQYPSRIRALLNDLPTDERSVVFVSSKQIVMLLLQALSREGVEYRALYAGQKDHLSGCAVSDWQTIDSCKVLVVQAGIAACGLTLTAARKMFILDPFLKHEEEKQAYARIHRIGQTKKVEIKVYYAPLSIESRLLEWRERSGSENQDAATISNVFHGFKPGEEDDDSDDEDQIEFLLGRESGVTDEESESADDTFV